DTGRARAWLWVAGLLSIALVDVSLQCALAKTHQVSRPQPVTLSGSFPPPPSTRQVAVTDTLHGVPLTDPYRWLEDQTSAETRAWVDAQNAYTQSVIGTLPGREEIERDLGALMRNDATRTPIERGGRYFYEKRLADQDLYMIYVRDGAASPAGGTTAEAPTTDRVLVDPHPLSEDHSTNVDLLTASEDGTLLAYGIRKGGEDETTIRFRDVASGNDLPDELPRADYYEVVIAPDMKTVYYSLHDSIGPHVLTHTIGTDPAGDQEIFGKAYGPEMTVSVSLSQNGRWVVFAVYYGSASRCDIYYWDTTRRGFIMPLVKDIDADFAVVHAGDHLYLKTDWEAPRGRVIDVDLTSPRRENWRDVVPETEDVIEGAVAIGGKIFVTYIHNVVPTIRIYEPDGSAGGTVELPAMGYVGEIKGRWDGNEAFFYFSSFHVAPRIYRYDIAARALSVWAEPTVAIKSDLFEVSQVWFESRDGARVPMFLASRRGLALDGANPVLLVGYGGFRVTQLPFFQSQVAHWIMQGGVYALPGLRGGSEFGEEWHRAGMLDKKQNTFDDFIAAAEWLIREGYTNPSKIAISGGSNGGLLVGAAMTQRPDLFKAVVCWHPLLDMIRYHRFLVASFWVPEYGSSDDPEQFKYISAYSPYQRVTDGVEYPALFMVSGDADTRVDPLHARKMVARLQAAAAPTASAASSASSRPVLLQYDTKAGHMGGKPLSEQIEDKADEVQFLMWQLGMEP
ncbi:MAG: prolyl oligopeptidase family serine peptidase, partial [bacterium]